MALAKTPLIATAGALVLGALAGATFYHQRIGVTPGTSPQTHEGVRLKRSGQVLAYSNTRRIESPMRRGATPAVVDVDRHPSRRRLDLPAPPAPPAPLCLTQIGGVEPAQRGIAVGSWLNSTTLELVLRLKGRATSSQLQPQVEIRPANQPFTGRPNVTGRTVDYRGAAASAVVRISGLRDGLAYHWQARTHDLRGPNSPWRSGAHLSRVAFRVLLASPTAPRLFFATHAQPGGWVGTRQLNLVWTPPRDRSGVRGYSYDLSRDPLSRPALHILTSRSQIIIVAHSDGLWYFTVRALNFAHSWGPPARMGIRIDSVPPRLSVLSAPLGPVNPRRANPLVRLQLSRWSRVTLDVVAADGTVVRSILSHWHSTGFELNLTWDGKTSAGRLAPNGHYLLRILAVNRGGVLWQTNRPLYALTHAPVFVSYGMSQTDPYDPSAYNPYNNSLDGLQAITATLDSPAAVRIDAIHGARVLRSWQMNHARQGQVATVLWDGQTTNGSSAPGGYYTFRAQAIDAAGNSSTAELGSVRLDHRHIVVSLDAQQMWALDGSKVLLNSYVTSGGPELPTPTGEYQIIDRQSPFTFHSPYPPGSPFWYRDSPVNFALLFQANGYFIHDAPWRSVYGPGTNAVVGTPGGSNTGTHGCVNVPYDAMAWLFQWATMYTPVQVYQKWAPR